LKEKSKIKRKLFHKFIKTPTLENEINYKLTRNSLNAGLKRAKNTYLKFIVNSDKSNKKLWGLVNNLTKSGTYKHSITLTSNGISTTNHIEIAESFNNFFSSIGNNLAEKLPITNTTFESFMPEQINNSIFLSSTNLGEITEILRSLPNKNSAGLDNISPKLLKLCCLVIAPTLTNLINAS
jgi:hypothetical protein